MSFCLCGYTLQGYGDDFRVIDGGGLEIGNNATFKLAAILIPN